MMPDTNMERKRHNPQVLVDTENLTREEWLDWRRRGIGGSDVSAIIGISPFRTARDIYYDKLGIAAVEEDVYIQGYANCVQVLFHMGLLRKTEGLKWPEKME